MLTKNEGLIGMLCIFLFIISACGNNNVEQAEKLIESKMYDQAITLLNTETQQNPKNADAHFTLGVANLHKGDTTEATEAFNRAIALNKQYEKKTANQYFEIGKQNLNDGNLNYANSLFNRAAERDSALSKTIAEEYFIMGKSRFGTRNDTSKLCLKQALTFYEKSGIDKKDYSVVNYLLGYLEYSNGNFSQAMDWFKKCENLDPNHLGNLSFLADCYLLTDNIEIANKHYERVSKMTTLEDNWSDITYKTSDTKNEKTLIVKVDRANVFSIENDEITGTVSKHDIFFITKEKNRKLFFKDTKNQVYIKSEGWAYYEYILKQRVPFIVTLPVVDPENCPVIFTKVPANIGTIYDDFILHSPHPGYDYRQVASLIIDKKSIKPGSLNIMAEWQEERYGRLGNVPITAYFAKVNFEKLEAIERWISESDVIIGTGDIENDRARLNLLRKLSFLAESRKEKIFLGFIAKGMTKGLVKYALGKLKLEKVKLIDKTVILEVYKYGSSYSLEFKDNMLFQWEKI